MPISRIMPFLRKLAFQTLSRKSLGPQLPTR